MTKRKTAGEQSLKASGDSTKYDSLEVGYALTDDIVSCLDECIYTHNKIFDMDEYCVVMVIAGDPLLKNVMRRKFYGYPYLPSPRPNQTVFMYSKLQHKITKRLWVLPHVLAMETLYETPTVSAQFRNMKAWSHAFYDGCFWDFIRKQHEIFMLSESEYLEVNREELVKARGEKIEPIGTDAFDFSKIAVNKIVHPYTPVFD